MNRNRIECGTAAVHTGTSEAAILLEPVGHWRLSFFEDDSGYVFDSKSDVEFECSERFHDSFLLNVFGHGDDRSNTYIEFGSGGLAGNTVATAELVKNDLLCDIEVHDGTRAQSFKSEAAEFSWPRGGACICWKICDHALRVGSLSRPILRNRTSSICTHEGTVYIMYELEHSCCEPWRRPLLHLTIRCDHWNCFRWDSRPPRIAF